MSVLSTVLEFGVWKQTMLVETFSASKSWSLARSRFDPPLRLPELFNVVGGYFNDDGRVAV